MRAKNSVDLVDQLARCDVKNQDGFEVLRGGEKTVSFEVDFKVIKVSFDVFRKLIGLYEPQWLRA